MAGFYKLIQTRLMYTSRRVLLVKKMFCVENPMTLILFPILSSYFDGQHAIYKCGFNLFLSFLTLCCDLVEKKALWPPTPALEVSKLQGFFGANILQQVSRSTHKKRLFRGLYHCRKSLWEKTTLVHSKTHSFLKSTYCFQWTLTNFFLSIFF